VKYQVEWDAEEEITLATMTDTRVAHIPVGKLCFIQRQHRQGIKAKVDRDRAVSTAKFALIDRADPLVAILSGGARAEVQTGVLQMFQPGSLDDLWAGVVHLHQAPLFCCGSAVEVSAPNDAGSVADIGKVVDVARPPTQ